MTENIGSIESNTNAGSIGDSPANQQPRFTKRKQFLFFKIKSKPINQARTDQPARKVSNGIKNPEPIGWIISIMVAAAVIIFSKYYGIGIVVAVVFGILSYAIIFGIFAVRQSRKVKRYMQREKIISSITGEQVYQEPIPSRVNVQQKQAQRKSHSATKKEEGMPSGPLGKYIDSTVKKRKTLEMDLRAANIKKSPYEFVKSMMLYAIIVAVTITIVLIVVLEHFGAPLVLVILGPVIGFGVYMAMFNRFMMYPKQRNKVIGRNVERDILFAARDIVIGMRSGMPLYNAIAAVSVGYGDASREFGKIVELTQLGMPIEQAMDQISEKSQSKTFKRLMLQATVSIKAGVDVTSALQDVVDDVTQERVIDLRRYGQKLNALAMFYMLFGVIFPSMGIAVATIMSTFISIFPITYIVLIVALIFIAFVQVILLNIMKNSRPVFSM